MYNDRSPRPGELDGIDYHFRSKEEIEKFRNSEDHLVMQVRNDLHAIYLKDMVEKLKKGHVIFEGSTFAGIELLNNLRLSNVSKIAVFVSPFSKEEIIFPDNGE